MPKRLTKAKAEAQHLHEVAPYAESGQVWPRPAEEMPVALTKSLVSSTATPEQAAQTKIPEPEWLGPTIKWGMLISVGLGIFWGLKRFMS